MNLEETFYNAYICSPKFILKIKYAENGNE